MSGALIVIDQIQGGPVSPGSPGVSRDDLWLLGQVQLVCASVNASYDWEILDFPPGSTATLDTPNAQTCNFTPDLYGTYLIRLITNGGGAGNVQVLDAIVRFDALGVQANRGWRIPALGETTEDNVGGSVRGWDRPIRFILEDLEAQGTFRDDSYGAAPGDTWVWSGAAWGPGPGGGAIPLTGDVEQGPPNVVTRRINRALVGSDGLNLTEDYVLTVVAGATEPRVAKYSASDSAVLVLRIGTADIVKYVGDPGERPSATVGYRFPGSTFLNDFTDTATKIFASSPFVVDDGPGIPGGIYRLDKTSEVVEDYIDFTADTWTGVGHVVWEPVSDSIWASEDGAAGGLARVDPSTMVRTLVVLPGASRILDLFVYNGLVYATGDNGSVWQINPAGNVVTTGTPGTQSMRGGAGAAGRVWVIEEESGTLFRLFEAGLAVDASLAGWDSPIMLKYQAGSAVPPALERIYVLDQGTKTIVPAEDPQGVMTYSTDTYTFPGTSNPRSFDILPAGFLAVVPDGNAGLVYEFGTTVADGTDVEPVEAAGYVDWRAASTAPAQYEFVTVAANMTVPTWRTIAPQQVMSVDTSGGAITVEAPPQVGPAAPAAFIVKDATGQAATNPITVQDTANGFLFEGSPTYVLSVARVSATFVFNTSTSEWNVL